MNIWTAFFLVVSIVILASPVLLSQKTLGRNSSGRSESGDSGRFLEDDELELDLACGRLAREDYEAMSVQKLNTAGPDGCTRGDHGSFSEG